MKRALIAVVLAGIVTACGSGDCPGGFFDCGGACTDLMNDPGNCGGCGLACSAGQVCVDGTCQLSCPDGYENCSGTCRDLAGDSYNCGSCGMSCASGHVCVDGTCAPDCPDGYTDCSGICKNLENDPSNCGECGNACAAGEVCSAGSCEFECPSGYTDCSGTCADLMTDHLNCGSCDSACLGAQVCVAGTCSPSCPSGFVNCSGACRDVARDHDNCGSCARACETDQVCVGGTCVANCPGGFSECEGACFDFSSDRLHCGDCDTQCAVGQVCNSGTCETTCPSYLTNCSGVCSDLSNDPDNCGTCGHACALAEGCISGSCVGVILVGPSPTQVLTTTAVLDTYLTSSPYADKHDGGMVYSGTENAIYAIYGNDNQGRNVYRIDHHSGTSATVATLTYGRHGSHPVIDETGGYIYFPPSQNTNQLERMQIGGSHTVTVRAVAPSYGTFAHGTFKNGRLWIVLTDGNLYAYDPSADSWGSSVHSYGRTSMAVAHGNSASDNIYVWVSGGGFFAYDTVAATNTSLATFTGSTSLYGNGQIEYIPSAEGFAAGFVYAVDGCSGTPYVYSIRDDRWDSLTDPKNNTNCAGHATYDYYAMRLYVTGGSTGQIWYYQY